MATEFGKYIRILRIEHGELLRDMAIMLNATLSYLSSVELGKREVPAEWLEPIAAHYKLSPERMNELTGAMLSSNNAINCSRSSAKKMIIGAERAMNAKHEPVIFREVVRNIDKSDIKKFFEAAE